MKACPHCRIAPHWHYARNTTYKRGGVRGEPYFLIGGCAHLENFIKCVADLFVADRDRAAFEARWDDEAARLFANYTERWTEAERAVYAAKLWPVPPPVIPTELFARESA